MVYTTYLIIYGDLADGKLLFYPHYSILVVSFFVGFVFL